jgi:hypothetical protein
VHLTPTFELFDGINGNKGIFCLPLTEQITIRCSKTIRRNHFGLWRSDLLSTQFIQNSFETNWKTNQNGMNLVFQYFECEMQKCVCFGNVINNKIVWYLAWSGIQPKRNDGIKFSLRRFNDYKSHCSIPPFRKVSLSDKWIQENMERKLSYSRRKYNQQKLIMAI